MATYQQGTNGYQYQNIPSSEQPHDSSVDTSTNSNIHSSSSIPADHGASYAIDTQGPAGRESNINSNNYQQQYTHESSSYRMPSYQDYVQNLHPYYTNQHRTDLEGNYGSSSDGFMDWSYYRRQSKVNRIILITATVLFVLFLLSHPAAQSHDSSTTNSGSSRGHSTSSSSSSSSSSTATQKQKGVAGDEPSLPAVPPNAVTSNDNHQVSSHTDVTNANANTDDEHTSVQNLNITYLLAYPMSGSTFTMFLVTIATNTTLGTNYDFNAFTNDGGHHIPIFFTSQDSRTDATATIGSPFWFETFSSTNRPLKNVLTYSQCAGYCMYPCTPNNYILTADTFDESCRTVMEQGQQQGVIYESITPKSKVTKVVHLIRDPFSNVVSRFHADLRIKAANHELSKMHPNTMEGFHSWCRDMDNDANLVTLEMESPLISLEVKELMQSIPCHGEFYKYISWHNHVVEMVWNEEYPYLQIYYEDFTTKDMEQKQAIKIAEFLEEPLVSNNYSLPDYLVVRSYSDFFKELERQNIEKFIRALAYKKVMVMLERYFDVGG